VARAALVLALVALTAAPASAQLDLDRLLRGLPPRGPAGAGPGDARIAEGLKEALRVGADNAVGLTGRLDGYFANQAIRILMPPELGRLESALRAVGLGAQVDAFVLGMNRAAERAAPEARGIFWQAIAEMTFDDARRILAGGETAATDHFRARTTDRLVAAFRPIVETRLNEVGVTRQYKDLVAQVRAIPFLDVTAYDIDSYVVGKALDGLFVVLADEERRIRTDPAARVTEILRDVFSGR